MPQGGAPVTPVDKLGNVMGGRTDANGSAQVTPFVGSTAIGASPTNADGIAASSTSNSMRVSSYSLIYNGTTFDRQRKANLSARVVSSAAGGNPAIGKASAGDVRQFWGQNGAVATYLQIYNKATAPVIGTDTPVLSYPIPASAVFSNGFGDGMYFGTGIAYAFTTDAAGTTAAAAAAVTSFNLIMS